MRRLIIVTIMAVFSHAAVAADTYLCIPDKSTGFTFNKVTHQWGEARFGVDGKKYFLKNDKGNWQWTESGDSERSPVRCSNFNNYDSMSCTGFYEITFNRKSLRFQKIYADGYINNPDVIGTDKEGTATPYMEIGTCSLQ